MLACMHVKSVGVKWCCPPPLPYATDPQLRRTEVVADGAGVGGAEGQGRDQGAGRRVPDSAHRARAGQRHHEGGEHAAGHAAHWAMPCHARARSASDGGEPCVPVSACAAIRVQPDPTLSLCRVALQILTKVKAAEAELKEMEEEQGDAAKLKNDVVAELDKVRDREQWSGGARRRGRRRRGPACIVVVVCWPCDPHGAHACTHSCVDAQ